MLIIKHFINFMKNNMLYLFLLKQKYNVFCI
jgi:hypothetical protein